MRKSTTVLAVLGSLSVAMILCAGLRSHAAAPAPGSSGYHVIKTVPIPGDEGWDYLNVDAAARRVYISHGSHVVVMNADTYAIEGDVPDTQGVHGIALAPDLGRGFVSAGRANIAVIFDIKSLKTLGTVKTDANPDAIVYDAVTKRVFTLNGPEHHRHQRRRRLGSRHPYSRRQTRIRRSRW
jgi:DNA-binding beta-propeller fold protein YncE